MGEFQGAFDCSIFMINGKFGLAEGIECKKGKEIQITKEVKWCDRYNPDKKKSGGNTAQRKASPVNVAFLLKRKKQVGWCLEVTGDSGKECASSPRCRNHRCKPAAWVRLAFSRPPTMARCTSDCATPLTPEAAGRGAFNLKWPAISRGHFPQQPGLCFFGVGWVF